MSPPRQISETNALRRFVRRVLKRRAAGIEIPEFGGPARMQTRTDRNVCVTRSRLRTVENGLLDLAFDAIHP